MLFQPRDVERPFGTLHENAPPETAHWGQLAGVWDCSLAAGSHATWTWAYILDGYAVQDTYVGAPREDGSAFHGTGLRVYNAAREKWDIAWTANATADDMTVTRYEATSGPREVVMAYSDGEEPEWRTTFSNIERDSFEWSNEPSGQTMRCTRRR